MKFTDLLESKKYLTYKGGCSTCPRKLVDFVPATLREDSKILVVGEAPGAVEVEKGEGFSGRSGQFLRASLRKAGIQEEEYSLSNTIHCRPPDNRNPTDKEISCCMSQFTMKEVEGFPVVVLVGGVPAKAFFPGERYKNMRGNVMVHPDFPGQKFYTIYHPSYIIRNKTRDTLNIWKKQLERLRKIVNEGNDADWKTYHGDHSDFLDNLKTVLNRGKFTFDLETNSLKSWSPDSRILSFSICSTENAALFCHEDDLVWKEALEMVAEALTKPKNVCIGHNIGFDIDYMEQKLGIHSRCRVLDTQCLYYLLYQEKMPSLKYLTSKYLDGYRFLIPHPDECTDIELLAKYNTEDVIRTHQLVKKGFPLLSDKQKDLVFRVSSPSSVALRRLTSTGFYFDAEEAKKSKQELKEERQKIIAMWQKEDPKFDPDKHLDGDGLIWYMYTHKNLPVVSVTDKSQKPSTDKHTINKLKKEHDADFLDWLVRLKAVDKFENTFLDDYLSGKYMDFDQRVHADYLNTSTKTGRSSSSSPNSQQQPRDDTIRKTEIEGISKPFSIRKLYTVPEGNVLLHSDLSQIELRVLMSLARDPIGIKAYEEEGDLHMQTARMIAAGEGREATALDRTHAKPTNFGLCVPMESQVLTQDGFKQYEDVIVGKDKTLGYSWEGKLVWTKIIDKIKQENKETIEMSTYNWKVVTTPNHRWYGDHFTVIGKSEDGGYRRGYKRKVFTSDEMGANDRIWLSSRLSSKVNTNLDITTQEAAIIGWLYTDGSIVWQPESDGPSTSGGKRRGLSCYIHQKKERFVKKIINLLSNSGYKYSTYTHKNKTKTFTLRAVQCRDLLRRAGLEYGSLSEFVLKLGPSHLKSFLEAVQYAEGTETYDYTVITQNRGEVYEALKLAIFMSGYYPGLSSNGVYKKNESMRLRMRNPTVGGQKLKKKSVGAQDVFCVQTECGSWTMQQNEQIMVTGNSYCHKNEAYTLRKNAENEYGVILSEKQSQEYSDTFFNTYKNVRPWQLRQVQNLKANNGYAETVMGHKWYYPDYNSSNKNLREKAERECINLQCQSTAGYITLYILYLFQQELHKRGLKGVYTVGSVHDSILTEVPKHLLKETIQALQHSVKQVEEWISSWFLVPLVMDFEVGPNWSQLQKVDPAEIN